MPDTIDPDAPGRDDDEGGGTAVKEPPKKSKKPDKKPQTKGKPSPKRGPPEMLPPWKVLLHNDDENAFDHVIGTIVELTTLNAQDAETRAKEAHDTGVSLLLVTHKERAELYEDQFKSKSLVVTIEPAE